MPNSLEEYQRLTQRYREMGDTELLEMARQIDDLTETAREVLRAEILLRHLSIPTDDATKLTPEKKLRSAELGHFALLSPDNCVWEFAQSEDAQAAAEMLAESGIFCDIFLPRAENLDMRAPRIAVLPDDVDNARYLLSKPIPEEFRILVRTTDQFTLPTCPECGSPDPLLESIEPANQWLCEVCGKVWSDTLPT